VYFCEILVMYVRIRIYVGIVFILASFHVMTRE